MKYPVGVAGVAAITILGGIFGFASASSVLDDFVMAQQGQALPPVSGTLKVTTNVVNVYAVARQRNGRLVPDLSKDNFLLEEDQRPQDIRYFSRETDTPLTMGILVDTSTSQEHVLQLEKSEAQQFLTQTLRARDLAFVLHFDSEVELLQDFTADLHLLNQAVGEAQIGGGELGRTPGTFPSRESSGEKHLYDAVYLSARELLKDEVGRKVLILLTDGADFGGKVSLDRALEAAQRADAIIYSIDISDPADFGRYCTAHKLDRYRMFRRLQKLSEETGGRVIKASNKRDSSVAFQQLARELRTQYLLGYTPTNSKLDGTFRRIEVKVRNGNAQVSARRGYYAPTR